MKWTRRVMITVFTTAILMIAVLGGCTDPADNSVKRENMRCTNCHNEQKGHWESYTDHSNDDKIKEDY